MPVALLYRDDYVRDRFVAAAERLRTTVAFMGSVYVDSLPNDDSGPCRPILLSARLDPRVHERPLLLIVELPQNWMLFNCVTLLASMWPNATIAVRAPARSSFLAAQLASLSQLVRNARTHIQPSIDLSFVRSNS
jgi:hypothetical protein